MASGAFVGKLQHIKVRQALEGRAKRVALAMEGVGGPRNPASATHWAFWAGERTFVRPGKRRRKRRGFYALTVF